MPQSARDLSVSEFAYDLPDDRIARHPVAERDGAKQLYYREGNITHGLFRDLPQQLPPGSLLIGNRTRVIHARLRFPLGEHKRPVEIFCLDPLVPADHARALGASSGSGTSEEPVMVQWKCLVGGNRRWKRGPLSLDIPLNGNSVRLTAERLERQDNTFRIAFSWTAGEQNPTFGEILAAAGTLPLPPYLGRETEAADEERYQTVFAIEEGSVAAPTAGLHFTPSVLAELAEKGIAWRELLLHVGAGTFKPVTSPTLGGHDMHQEYFTADRKLLEAIIAKKEAGLPVVSIGTTSLRCLESLFYLGAQCHLGIPLPLSGPVTIGQWVAEDGRITAVDTVVALSALRKWLGETERAAVSGHTSLLLTPVSSIRVADALITNFHQPRSTLLLLVAALVGDDWRKIYAYALEHDFRFLSYGDSSLLWKRTGA